MSRLLLATALFATLSGCAMAPVGDVEPVVRPPVAHPDRVAPALPSRPASPALVEERARQAYETGRWDVAEGY